MQRAYLLQLLLLLLTGFIAEITYSFALFPQKSALLSRLNAAAQGSLYLVGAGPGDPELLTLQSYKLLKNASLVVSDRLISKEILDLVECELKIANKLPGCAETAQEEINKWVIDGVLAGETVVRLKIGDPFMFGRGGEEVLEYRKHGIEPVVCGGLSSAYTAPLAANIPVTHRDVSNQLLVCTGYGKNSSIVDLPNYHAERTVVILMGVGRIAQIAHNLTMDHGYPAETPVSIIEKATTPQQRVMTGTLATIGGIALKEKAIAPATIVIGNVVNVLR